jgi:hypothetical protein
VGIFDMMITEIHDCSWFKHSAKFLKHFFLIIEFMKNIKENNKIKAVVRKGSRTA